MAEDLRAAIVGVAQMHRNRARATIPDRAGGRAERRDDAVALRREREMDHRVREVDRDFRQPDVLDGPGGRVGNEEGLRIGEADVLTREDDEPARDEPRILTRFEHPREPVQARVGIGAANRLDESGDDVVMLVVAVAHAAQRERGLRVGQRDGGAVGLDGQRVRDFEHREQVPGVALALVDQMAERVVVDLGRLGAQSALDVDEREPRELLERRIVERLETEQRAAREQRAGEREERVLGRRADEYEQALLDERQQDVLLCAREAVNLVEEQDRPLSPLSESRPCPFRDLAHVLDARAHRAERLERLLAHPRDEPGDRRLARAGRTPNDDRRQPIRLDQDP